MNARLLLRLLACSPAVLPHANAGASHWQASVYREAGARLGGANDAPPHIQAALRNYRVSNDARASPLGSRTDVGAALGDESAPPCSPTSEGVPGNTSDAFYAALLARTQSEGEGEGEGEGDSNSTLQFPLPPPTFAGVDTRLCDARTTLRAGPWDYCLPITTSQFAEPSECARADRFGLLDALPLMDPTSSTAAPLCHTSVLHLLLEDVYAVLEAHGAGPALLFGTMLGAVRDGGIIPWTRDVDLGYQADAWSVPQVAAALRTRGYHAFKADVWRVCVAPTHPLAALLYDPSASSRRRWRRRRDSYVDLYAMCVHGDALTVDKTRRALRAIPLAKALPYAHVEVFGSSFATLADPDDFLTHEYGEAFMVPDKRR